MLAQIVTDMRKDSSDINTLMCEHKNWNGMDRTASKDMGKTLKDTAKVTNLQQCGFTLSRACPHSSRAGCSIVLKLSNVGIAMIKKCGRWSSGTFLTCMHEQTSSLGRCVSIEMDTKCNMQNK